MQKFDCSNCGAKEAALNRMHMCPIPQEWRRIMTSYDTGCQHQWKETIRSGDNMSITKVIVQQCSKCGLIFRG